MLHMSRDAFLELHDHLVPFGLQSTRECTSREALAVYIATCVHGTGVRQVKDRFERSLQSVARQPM
jgi:predicted chitinase